MPTKIDSGGGYQAGYDDGNAAGSASGSSTRAGKLHFPDGWSLHATALGESFPGFGSNVIPVCMNVRYSGDGGQYWDDTHVNVHVSGSASINGNTVTAASYNKNGNGGHTGIFGGWANNIFLPAYYGFNWSAIQSSITSGTITVWLTKD